MHEIYIYGDIVPFKYWGDGEFDLKDLNSALNALEVKEGDTVTININTFGGCTVTGFAMFNKIRRFAADKKVTIATRVDGFCASIGVVILLAGDVRIGNAYAEPFVHNAWTWDFAIDKNQAKKIFDDLTKTDNQIATLYADRTNISVEKGLELMNADTWISPDDCMAFGFYTELENVMVVDSKEVFNSLRAIRKNNNFNNNIDMSKQKKDAKSLFGDIRNSVNKYLGITSNKLLATAEGTELDFYELAEDEIPVVRSGDTTGSKALYGGKPAGESNDGEYLMASGETYKFEGEELVEIVAAEEDTENDADTENSAEQIAELTAEVNALKAEKATLSNKLKETKNKLSEADKIIKAINALDPDEEEDEEDEAPARDPKNKNKVPTRNLFGNIK